MSGNLTWPPDATVLQFPNCSQILHLWTYYQSDLFPPVDYLGGWYDGRNLTVSLNTGLTNYLETNHLPQPSKMQLLKWLLTADVQMMIASLASHNCDLCPYRAWEGNSDIAGVGMLVTYIVQAVLVTIYVPALLAIRFDKVSTRNQDWFSKAFLATKHSSSTFLSASFMFSIAMLFAALISFARLALYGPSDTNYTTWVLTVLMPVASVLPILQLQLAASGMLRRSKGRNVLWVLLGILLVVVLALSVHEYSHSFEYRYQKSIFWMWKCFQKGSLQNMLYFAWALAGTLLLGLCSFAIGSFVSRIWHGAKSLPTQTFLKISWWAVLILSFCSMWFSLGWFIQFQVQSRRIGGEKNKENEWSFGQILALATWVPVFVEFAYLWWETPADALSGRLMAPFEVVEVSKQSEAFELNRAETV